MSYEPTIWQDRQLEVGKEKEFKITKNGVEEIVEIEKTGIEVEGTKVNAEKLNSIEGRISESLVSVEQPSSFSGSPSDEQVNLSWFNPDDREVEDTDSNTFIIAEFEKVELKRDGTIIYEGTAEEFEDTGLTNDVEYEYEIVSITKAGKRSEPLVIKVTPTPFTMDLEYNVSDLTVTGITTEGEKVIFEWENPVEADFEGVLIRRKEGSFPVDIFDGDLVYDDDGESVEDTGLTNDVEYFYTIWAYNDSNQYSDDANKIEVTATPTDFDLGVGNQTLLEGSLETAGYFGEVTLSDFANGESGFTEWSWVDNAIGLGVGDTQNQTVNLLKYVHDGKIKFIQKKSTRNDLSWNHIFNALADFSGDVVSDTMSEGASASQWQQFYEGKEVEIGGYTYKVRLMRGVGRVKDGSGDQENQIMTDSYDDTDRASIWESTDDGVTGNWNHESRNEWNTLILPLHEDSDEEGENKDDFSHPDYAPDFVPSWDSFDDTELNVTGDGRAVWCQETRDTDTARRVYRGLSGSSNLLDYLASLAFAPAGSRFVFELL